MNIDFKTMHSILFSPTEDGESEHKECKKVENFLNKYRIRFYSSQFFPDRKQNQEWRRSQTMLFNAGRILFVEQAGVVDAIKLLLMGTHTDLIEEFLKEKGIIE